MAFRKEGKLSRNKYAYTTNINPKGIPWALRTDIALYKHTLPT